MKTTVMKTCCSCFEYVIGSILYVDFLKTTLTKFYDFSSKLTIY